MSTKAKKKKVVRKDALPEDITIKIHADEKVVLTEDFIKAKTLDLIDFGYSNLTEDDVRKQLLKIANKGKLDVIGILIEKDVAEI